MSRTIRQIALDIRKEWKKIHFAAEPYLSAMMYLDNKNSQYGYDSAKSIVLYFLGNARSFHGEKAKALKQELKDAIK